MTAYRIQHRRLRVGPYRAHHKCKRLKGMCSYLDNRTWFDTGRWPIPQCDGISPEVIEEDTWFGFKSKGQLINWFAEWSEKLHENGFVVAIYRNAEVLDEGRTQLAFRKKRACKLVPIPEFIAA